MISGKLWTNSSPTWIVWKKFSGDSRILSPPPFGRISTPDRPRHIRFTLFVNIPNGYIQWIQKKWLGPCPLNFVSPLHPSNCQSTWIGINVAHITHVSLLKFRARRKSTNGPRRRDNHVFHILLIPGISGRFAWFQLTNSSIWFFKKCHALLLRVEIW